jgi:hypothetical protein
MSMDWFRSHHGAPTDPKWLLIAKRANVRPIHVIGTWWALLDYASQHSDRGSIDGFDTETFALFAGLEDEHVSRIVTTLRDKGLIIDGRIAQWAKRQPKREDEGAAERQRRHRAEKPKNGGNPPSGGKQGTPDDTTPGERHAMSRNVTPDTDKIREDTSVANATGTVVPHPAADFCKAIFDSGVALLTASGMTERNARGHLGRLRAKLNDDPAMLTILREAEIAQHSDPAAWLVASVETRLGTRQPRQLAGKSDLRGSRPDPALDLTRAARAAEAAEAEASTAGGGEGDWRAWAALPAH